RDAAGTTRGGRLRRRDFGRPRAVPGRRVVSGLAGLPTGPDRSHPAAGLNPTLSVPPQITGTASDALDSPALVARGIHKSYAVPGGRLEVLREIDLEVARGTLLAIVGASGSGKSTLLNVLGTLDRPDAGTLEVDGRRLESLSERERCEW